MYHPPEGPPPQSQPPPPDRADFVSDEEFEKMISSGKFGSGQTKPVAAAKVVGPEDYEDYDPAIE